MPTINRLYLYRKTQDSKPKLVLITDGAYSVNGRVSNFWDFTYITKNGFLSSKKGGDYDNAAYKFKPAKGYRLEIKVEKVI